MTKKELGKLAMEILNTADTSGQPFDRLISRRWCADQ
jgi:hypothetical protein